MERWVLLPETLHEFRGPAPPVVIDLAPLQERKPPEQSDPEAARQAMQHLVEQASFLSALLTSGGKAPRESAGVAAKR